MSRSNVSNRWGGESLASGKAPLGNSTVRTGSPSTSGSVSRLSLYICTCVAMSCAHGRRGPAAIAERVSEKRNRYVSYASGGNRTSHVRPFAESIKRRDVVNNHTRIHAQRANKSHQKQLVMKTSSRPNTIQQNDVTALSLQKHYFAHDPIDPTSDPSVVTTNSACPFIHKCKGRKSGRLGKRKQGEATHCLRCLPHARRPRYSSIICCPEPHPIPHSPCSPP